MTAYSRLMEKVNIHIAFDSSMASRDKVFTIFLFSARVCRRTLGQKEIFTTEQLFDDYIAFDIPWHQMPAPYMHRLAVCRIWTLQYRTRETPVRLRSRLSLSLQSIHVYPCLREPSRHADRQGSQTDRQTEGANRVCE